MERSDAQRINLIRATEIEQAISANRQQNVLSFDLQKACDHGPHHILLAICGVAGMPQKIRRLDAYGLRNQDQHWKLRWATSADRK